MPFPVMQGMLAPSFPDGNHNYWKAVMMETLPDEAIDAAIADIEGREGAPTQTLAVGDGRAVDHQRARQAIAALQMHGDADAVMPVREVIDALA